MPHHTPAAIVADQCPGLLVLSALFALLLIPAHSLRADQESAWSQPGQRTLLTGTIGKNLRVLVDLSVFDTATRADPKTNLRGHYQYRHVGEPIQLTGRREHHNGEYRIALTESAEGKVTGRWNLRCDFSGIEDDAGPPTWVGTWTSPNGKVTHPVRLELAAEYELGRRTIGGRTQEWALPVPVSNAKAYKALAPKYEARRKRLRDDFTEASNPDVQATDFRPDRLRDRLYWYTLNTTVTWWEDDAVCILFDTYSYQGGAHPNTRFDTLMMTVEDGEFKEVQLKNVFIRPSEIEKTLSPLIVERLIAKGWANDQPDRRKRVFTAGDLLYFTVSARGLTVYFEPYAIGAYAEGAFVVTVPWDDLKDVIDPKGPMRRWVSR